MAGNAEMIIELDRKRMTAMAEKDTAALKNMLCKSLVYTHSSGRQDTKQSLIEGMESGSTVYTSMVPSDVKAQDLGKESRALEETIGTLDRIAAGALVVADGADTLSTEAAATAGVEEGRTVALVLAAAGSARAQTGEATSPAPPPTTPTPSTASSHVSTRLGFVTGE